MATLKQKRKEETDIILKTFDILDPSGQNSKRYAEILSKLTDEEYDKWMTDFLNNDDKNFYWEIEEFENDMDIRNIEKAADFLEVPLFEHVALPYITRDPDNIVVTPQPVLVGYMHQKRLQQMILKKNTASTHITKRNTKTGQVTGEDKNSRNTDVETYALMAMGAEKALAEFMGPRADDEIASKEMYNTITNDGFVKLEDLTNEAGNKTSIKTLDVYFLMGGIKTNLVSGGDTIYPPKKTRR